MLKQYFTIVTRRAVVRPIILAWVLLGCVWPLAAQEKCLIGRSIAPDYGGVVLGATPGELLKRFPASAELAAVAGAAHSGDKVFDASLGMLELNREKESFAGVEQLSLTFVGGRLHRLNIFFRAPAPWDDVVEMSEQMRKRLALPPAWGPIIEDAARHSRLMDCRGFAVIIRRETAGRSSLSIVDTTVGAKDY